MVPIPNFQAPASTQSATGDGSLRPAPLSSSVATTAAHTSTVAHLTLAEGERFQVRIGEEGRPEEKVIVSRVHVGGGTYAQQVDDTSLARIQSIFRDLKSLIVNGLKEDLKQRLTGGRNVEIKVRVNTATQTATVWVDGGQAEEVDITMIDNVRDKVEELHKETVLNFGTQASKIPFGKVEAGFSGFSSSRSALKGPYFDRGKLPINLNSYATELLLKRYPNEIEKQKAALKKMVKANTYRESLLSFIQEKIKSLTREIAGSYLNESQTESKRQTIAKLKNKEHLLNEADMFAVFSAVSHEIDQGKSVRDRAETLKKNVENDLKSHLRLTKQYMGIRNDRELSVEEKQYATLVGLAGTQMSRTEQIAFTSKYGLDHREQMKAEEVLCNCVFGEASLVSSFFKDIEGADYCEEEFLGQNTTITELVKLQEGAIDQFTGHGPSSLSKCLANVKNVKIQSVVRQLSSRVVPLLELITPTDSRLDGAPLNPPQETKSGTDNDSMPHLVLGDRLDLMD